MRKLLVLATLIFAATANAQLQPSALTIEAFASPADAAFVGSYLMADQSNRAAWLPVRVVASGGGEDVTFLVIRQSSVYDAPTIQGFPTAATPPLTFNSGPCAFTIGEYTINEFTTYSLARNFYDALIPGVKSLGYGPLATPKGTYLVAAPAVTCRRRPPVGF